MRKFIKNTLLIVSMFIVMGCGGDSGSSVDIKPTADAGKDIYFIVNNRVDLDGTASIEKGDTPLIYSWKLLLKPEGSLAELDDTSSAKPSFIADKNGEYIVELVVNNGEVDSLADSVSIKPAEIQDPNSFIAPTL